MGKRYVIHTLTVALIFLSTTSVFPGHARIDEVERIATDFLNFKNLAKNNTLKKKTSYHIEKTKPLIDPSDNTEYAYIIDLHPRGFIVVSTGNDEKAILAYSFRHDWNYESDGDDVLYKLNTRHLIKRKELLNDTITPMVQINRTQSRFQPDIKENADSKFYQWPKEGSTETGGWIETTWHQGDPYNKFCPTDTIGNDKSVVGCIGTAMAQVVNYHKYLGSLIFTEDDEYKTASRGIHIDTDSSKYGFPGFFALNNYMDKIRYKYKNNEEINSEEKAALCFACGVAIKMEYTSKASWIYIYKNIAQSLKDKIGYNSADYLLENKQFYHLLIENMMNGMPAILLLPDHAILVDGYNTDGFFHLNFGWGDGKPDKISDAWWRIPEYLPNGYEDIYNGVLNINPNPIDLKPIIEASESIIYLPCSKIGETSGSRHVTIKNRGETPIHIDDMINSANFFIRLPDYDFNNSFETITLQPGEELDLDIMFIPDTLGQFKGSIQVIASYSDVNRYLVIDLIGYGVPKIGTTVIEESISGIWEKERSPYYIDRNISIAEGEKLEIEPGTEIIFNGSFQFSIETDAQLIAKGTETDSIYFTALDTTQGWQGIYFKDSGIDDTLAYCVVTNGCPQMKLTHWNQGVITILSSSPAIAHSKIINNQTLFQGAAVYLYQSSAEITHTRLEENSCNQNGGALFMYKSSPLISNVVICNNKAAYGGAIYGYASSPSLVNITIADNIAYEKGGAIFLAGKNHINIKNSIIWANEARSGSTLAFVNTIYSDTISFNHSNIDTTGINWLFMGESLYISRNIIWEEGNLNVNPLFKDVENDKYYTLQFNSPCINAGDPTDDVGAEPEPNGNRINMGAYGGTRRAAIAIPVAVKVDSKPLEFRLSQNYPNPFNSRTIINYELPITNYVELSIYNVIGQKIVTLVAERQSAGQYSYQWDASDFASGAYFYRLIAHEPGTNRESINKVKKLILLK